MVKNKIKSNIGKCALCKQDNVVLRKSHIIPRLVYQRIQEVPNTRFRNLYQIKDIYQDGEKKWMLCHDCEQFFNNFETQYTNKVLDPYLKDEKPKELSIDITNNFINSISWRIIYDDLYNLKSFEGTDHRIIFKDFEKSLWKYIDEVRTGATRSSYNVDFINHTFYISDFNYKKSLKDLFESTTFGYCTVNKYGNHFIITSFLGLIFVTEYKISKYIIANRIVKNIFNDFKRSNLKGRVKEELFEYGHSAIQQYKKSEEILNGGLRQQIEKRYKKNDTKNGSIND